MPIGAYYLGILIVMGAPLSGQVRGSLVRELGSVLLWGILAVVLLNVASWLNRRVLFSEIDFVPRDPGAERPGGRHPDSPAHTSPTPC